MSLSLSRSLRRRVAVAVIGTALGAGGLTACGQSPSSAATVGEQTITIAQVQDETQNSLDDPEVGEALASYGEQTIRTFVLNQLVQVELANQIAETHGIEVDVDEALDTYLGGASIQDVQAQQGLSADMIEREAVIRHVVSQLGTEASGQTADQIQAEIETSIKAEYGADPSRAKDWQLSILPAESIEQADQWIAQINAGELTMEQIGATLPPDPSTGRFFPAQTPWNTRDGEPNPELQAQIDAIETGTVEKIVVPGSIDPANPQAAPPPTVLLIRVDSLTVAGDAEITAQAKQQAQEQFTQAGDTAAAEAAADISLTVNPRLGTIERPEQGLPGVAAPDPSTFSEPATSSAPAGIPGAGG